MTRKRAFFIAQLAAGMLPEDAAASAGYGAEYARKLYDDPQTAKAVAERREYVEAQKAAQEAALAATDEDKTPYAVLMRIAMDPLQDPRVRIAAIRALSVAPGGATYEEAVPIIIDDWGGSDEKDLTDG